MVTTKSTSTKESTKETSGNRKGAAPRKGEVRTPVIRAHETGLYYAHMSGGGRIPKSCEGYWVDHRSLQREIDYYAASSTK